MKKLPFVLFVLAGTFARESVAEGFYTDAHSLFVETIRVGEASGTMGGDIAERFKSQFKSDGALLVSSKVIVSYKQKGCARLQVDYSKKDVPINGGRTTARLNTQINYCLDGKPPTSLEVQ